MPAADEKQGLTQRRQWLDFVVGVVRSKQALARCNGSAASVGGSGRVIDFPMVLMEEGRDRVKIARGERGDEAILHRGRRIRANAPPYRAWRHDGPCNADTARRGGRRGGRRIGSARACDQQRSALGFPELDRAALLDVGVVAASGSAQHRRQCKARVGVVEQRVGGCRDRNSFVGEFHRRGRFAAASQRLGAHTAPGDRRLQIVAGQRLALARQRFGFLTPALGQQRAGQKRRGAGRIDAETEIAKPVVGAAQAALGGNGVALDQVDEPAEGIGLEHALRDAEVLDHLARGGQHAARCIGSTTQRFEHRLTAERDGLDRRRPLRDAQHTHDIETASAGTRDRARPPQRSERRNGQHRVRAATVVRTASSGQRAVESRLAASYLTETRERQCMNEVTFRLAGRIVERRQLGGGRRHRVGSRVQRLRCGQYGELAAKAGVPSGQARVAIGQGAAGEAAELGDCRLGRCDVSAREQGLAPVEREFGARGIVGDEPLERTAEQSGCYRRVVACERSSSGGGQAACGALAERTATRIERAELAAVLVSLFEMPPDRLVVLGRVLDLRLDPLGELLVKLGAGALEHAPVGRVADEYVMEAQNGLAEEPARVAFDQLGAPQRLQPGVEFAAVAFQQCRHGAAREMPADHGGALQHGAILRSQSFDARREQRVDGRRHLQSRQIGADDPALALALEGALVHQHAHQLADEKRVAFAGGEHLGGHRSGQVGGADHRSRKAHGGAGIEAAERDDVGHQAARRHHRRSQVAQFRTRSDQHEERRAAAPLHKVLDQIEQQRLGPVQVVDHQHHRLCAGKCGEQTANDEEGFLGGSWRSRQQRRDAGGDSAAFAVGVGNRSLNRRLDVLQARGRLDLEKRAQRRRQRGERRATGRIAVRRHHAHCVPQALANLFDEPRLSESG